ncbi:GTP cyclohydrolase I [Streptomyces sp. BE303]|uniref:GTP cyclohydrolase I n=1 Tax=Streptomyces sp. BE303 TaxID=3002528 RepID=UPI002E7631A6|nr:GTP cyclohydrolase I [Streptomyces sp. BE303]MED7950407.1 GTP cyclohydrolase I [Streptomyces sp. BE303]
MNTTLTAPAAPAAGPRAPIDTAAVETLVHQLLVALGEDPARPGLAETPVRVARFFTEFLGHEAGTTDTTFEYQAEGEGCVAVGGIRTASLCEHHLMPFTVEAVVAYAPANRVLGLSKLVRIVHRHAHKLQLQERLGAEIAEDVARLAGSKQVAVWMVGDHSCMVARGVRAHGTRTATEYLLKPLAADTAAVERLRRVAVLAGGAR